MAEQMSFACVISDYRMPDMDGASFLVRFREKQPDCVAILISGVAHIEEVERTFELAHTFSFVAKPWSDFELRNIVAQALARYRAARGGKVTAGQVR